MIEEQQATALAAEFVFCKLGQRLQHVRTLFQPDPTAIMRKHGFDFDPDDERCRPCWTVTFVPKPVTGGIFEGGVLIDVDAETGVARFFDDAFPTVRQATG